MKKTINIVLFYEIDSAAGNRILSYISSLKEMFNINLFLYDKKEIDIEGVNIIRLNKKEITKNNFFIRAFSEIYLSYKIMKKTKEKEADFLIITIPSMFLIPVFILDKRKKILDIRDLVWEYIDNKYIKYILHIVMQKSIKFYNKIIVTNQKEKDKLIKFNPTVIYNGISIEKFNRLQNLKFSSPEKFTITYIGNVGIAQDLIKLCKVGEKIPNINIKIIGNGAQYEDIKRYINKNKIENITLLGRLSWNELVEEYRTTSILYASLDTNFYSAIPSKLYEYLSTGLPILYVGKGGAAEEFLLDFKNIFIVNNNISDIVKQINRIKSINFVKSDYNIKKIKNLYIRENNSRKILDILERI